MIKAEKFSYPSTEQAANKINNINIEKYNLCDTNLTLINTYDQTIVSSRVSDPP